MKSRDLEVRQQQRFDNEMTSNNEYQR